MVRTFKKPTVEVISQSGIEVIEEDFYPSSFVDVESTPKFPIDLGECADLYYSLNKERLAQSKLLKEAEERQNALEDYIINNLSKAQRGVIGKTAMVEIKKKIIPTVKDWDVFYEYVRKKKLFIMLQKRLAEAAIKERWEAGEIVPGVEEFTKISLSVTKR